MSDKYVRLARLHKKRKREHEIEILQLKGNLRSKDEYIERYESEMKTLKEFIPFRSKSSSKNMSCYQGYLMGYKEAEKKFKAEIKELKEKTKPKWLKQED